MHLLRQVDEKNIKQQDASTNHPGGSAGIIPPNRRSGFQGQGFTGSGHLHPVVPAGIGREAGKRSPYDIGKTRFSF
jgi:hypothetical protein